MSNNDSKLSAALVVGVVALVLSVYSTISIAQMKQQAAGMGADSETGDFDKQVVRVIEGYINGEYAEPVEMDEGSGIAKGDKDAPVTIIEFSDYQCPFCKKYFDQTFPQIQAQYIDTGKVRYVFRDLPLSIHPQATPAANAARCVLEEGDLDDYWAYHDILFQNQANLTDQDLKNYAAQIDGIDAEKVGKCITEVRFLKDIQADLAAAQKAGISGTPAFFINGRVISGAQPFEAFQQVIEAALKDAKK